MTVISGRYGLDVMSPPAEENIGTSATPLDAPAGTPVLALDDVSFVRGDRTILDRITWRVEPGQHWLVLGANGSGKTTMLRIASLYEHPSSGTVQVLARRSAARTSACSADVSDMRRLHSLPRSART